MNLKLLTLRILVVSFLTILVKISYKIENEAEFAIFFMTILIGLAFLLAEIIQYEQSKN
jgi:hypothetical protein